MPEKLAEKLQKTIKKNIYGSPQSIKITYPPGFSDIALSEVNSILSSLWFPQKYTPSVIPTKNAIRIDNIHFITAIELLIRNRCLTDIRLIITESKAFGKNAFKNKCIDIPWDYYLNKTMSLKLKVTSIASEAFHETGLRNILSDILQDKVLKIVAGENSEETTTIFVDFLKNKFSLSISLAGSLLYKRGFRETLSKSAPLREDIAAACMIKSFEFANIIPETILIPFSGTGTFAFEYLQIYYQIAPALLNRSYALQMMPLYRAESFNYLFKKAKEHCSIAKNAPHIICTDTAELANTTFARNLSVFKKIISEYSIPLDEQTVTIKADDFLKMNISAFTTKSLYLPLNPPYGIRLNQDANSIEFYQQIAEKINQLTKTCDVFGFILCPTEQTWSAFTRKLICKKTLTYHMTQGGIDIRVCQFTSSSDDG